MKHLTLIATLAALLSSPAWAQPTAPIGGPIELRNPHRRGGDAPLATGPTTGNPYLGMGQSAVAAPPMLVPPPVAMFADESSLFVLRGDTLFQFDKKTLKLINSTELPRPVAPTMPQDDVRTKTSPPLRPSSQFNIGPTF